MRRRPACGERCGDNAYQPKKSGTATTATNIPATELPPIQTADLLTLPMNMVTAREDTSNDILCTWLRGLPWGPMQRESIERVLKAYHVGMSKDGKTIWWQIDYEGRVRTGKLMLYKDDAFSKFNALPSIFSYKMYILIL